MATDEDGEGVLVAEHGGLAEHLLVGLADGGLGGLRGGHAAADRSMLPMRPMKLAVAGRCRGRRWRRAWTWWTWAVRAR